MEISVPATELCQQNPWLQHDVAAEQSTAGLLRNTNFYFFFNSCRSIMSEFTPAIMNVIPENNFMQCINDTEISLSHAAFKNKLVGLDCEK